ncbi:MAG: haloacid dehalogenase, type II [Acidocella sp. 20-57-95]|nr:MAG: haloacid dehalogenase, type II [Acidocella sp. 20-57-95]HQT65821.1 haloacid dehalogenase type II [Acidocella sp.]
MTTPLSACQAYVFDAYGTLFDFGSAVARYADIPDNKRDALTTIWRDKQLQYTWLRSLQKNYTNFEQVTADALDFALEATALTDASRRQNLLDLYQTLSAYPEVPEALAKLKANGIITAVLSNGTPAMLKAAINHSGITSLIDHVLSVENVGIFKPAPEVYQLAIDHIGVPRDQICFISSNGWDAYSAAAFGFQVIWCNRSSQPAERLPGAPTVLMKNLFNILALTET